MKRIPLKIRYTIITSLFLLGSCVALMIFSNISADRMMRNIEEEILAEAVVPIVVQLSRQKSKVFIMN